jgi:hypothetical protein
LSLINDEEYKDEKPSKAEEIDKKKAFLKKLGPSAPMREAVNKNRKTIVPFRDFHKKVYFKTIEGYL